MTELKQEKKNIRVRFAPSPTGFLHIGGVRTALYNWLFARHNKGTFILRIEDTDIERSTHESINMIIEGLKWLGIDWEEGPYLQTDRENIYTNHIKKLLDEKKAYKCYCSMEDLEKMRKTSLANGENPKYNGKCRNLKEEFPKKPYVVRFKTPSGGKLVINDLIKGNISFDNSQFDDLIIMRSNKTPTYNFVVVVDDALMKITHVIRGDDHLSNTPRQIHLYNGLGYNLPYFIHLPMILGADKTRLSKRHGATSILEYKNMGYLPEAMLNYLARLGWSHGDQEFFLPNDLISLFNLKNINNSSAVFDPEKLTWLNSQHIKLSSPKKIAGQLKDHLVSINIIKEKESISEKEIIKLIPYFQERSKTLIEMAKGMEFYFKDIDNYEEKGVKKFFKKDNISILKTLLLLIKETDKLDKLSIDEIFSKIMKQTELKLGKVAQPTRLALTGKTASPGIFEVMLLIGKEKTIIRLEKAITYIEEKTSNL